MYYKKRRFGGYRRPSVRYRRYRTYRRRSFGGYRRRRW